MISVGRLALFLGFVLIIVSVLVGVASLREPSQAAINPRTAEPSPPRETISLQKVVVAVAPIGRGQEVRASDLGTLDVAGAIPPTAFSDPALVAGGIALEDFPAGSLIYRDGVALGEEAVPGLSLLVPEGLRAVALRVTDEIAVGNFIRPDDLVDIHVVLERPMPAAGDAIGRTIRESGILLQRVRVLSVGDALQAADGDEAIAMQTVTVAVTAEQAAELMLAKEVGRFQLALRNPTDTTPVTVEPVTLADIAGRAPEPPPLVEMAAETPPPPAPAPSAPPRRQVLVINGAELSYATVPSRAGDP